MNKKAKEEFDSLLLIARAQSELMVSMKEAFKKEHNQDALMQKVMNALVQQVEQLFAYELETCSKDED